MAEDNKFEFVWANEKSFMAALKEARAKVQDLRPAMALIAKDFFESEKSVFQDASGPGPYPDLTERYKKRKIKKWGFAYPVNKASGALMKSVTDSSDQNAIMQVNSTSFLVGSRVPYAAYVQRRRPFLFLGESSPYNTSETRSRIERWKKILRAYVVQSINGKDSKTGPKK